MCKEALRVRLGAVKGAKAHLGMAKYSIDAVFADVTGTVPEEQLGRYKRNMRGCSYTIGVKNPGAVNSLDADWGVWLDFKTLDILKDACRDRCLMCEKDRAQRRACTLRKALEAIRSEGDGKDGEDCPWWGGV